MNIRPVLGTALFVMQMPFRGLFHLKLSLVGLEKIVTYRFKHYMTPLTELKRRMAVQLLIFACKC